MFQVASALSIGLNILMKQSSYIIWGTELHEVTTCFAHRKSDGFDSHVLHHL
nr:MAG TPA: hypothetical protein [Caudoviricetes sp.]